MTASRHPRRPRAFSPDDPAVIAALDETASRPEASQRKFGKGSARQAEPQEAKPQEAEPQEAEPLDAGGLYRPSWHDVNRGMRWGTILVSALLSMSALAAGAWFMSFVSVILERQDWIGWSAFALLAVAGIACLAIIIREVAGLMRLGRLRDFRKDVEAALKSKDVQAERKCAARLKSLYRGRRDLAWALDRFQTHEGEIGDAGDLLTLAERDLMTPLDTAARLAITKSAKKVSVVTAISPAALLDILYVLAENLALLRRLAALYGARPGTLGGLRLAKLVVTHIVATGGIALTDDLFGQFLGQDLVRRLSRRLGEGVFNGALTARIGIAAIEVLRPLPFIAAKPVRLRELVPLIFRKAPGGAPGPD